MTTFICEVCNFGPCKVSWRHDEFSALPCLISGRKGTANWRKSDKALNSGCKCQGACKQVVTPEAHTTFQRTARDWRSE